LAGPGIRFDELLGPFGNLLLQLGHLLILLSLTGSRFHRNID
jgi:hypothetical protein